MNGFFQKIFFATGCAFELARGVIIFAVALALINLFIVTINVVSGPSMEPNFYNGQYVLVDRLSYLYRTPRRGEAVVIRFPGDPEKVRYIKRVVGLPGEIISFNNGKVFINGKQLKENYLRPDTFTSAFNSESVTVGPDEYFLLGDNRENSSDSRIFHAVEKRFITGLAYLILLPPNQAGLVPPQYY